MYIYKITNLINKKIYIGATSKNIIQRFKEHLRESKYNRINNDLYKDINFFGKENFIISLIEKDNNIEQLKLKENFWINFFRKKEIIYNKIESGFSIKNKRKKQINLGPKNGMFNKKGKLNPTSRKIVTISYKDEIKEYECLSEFCKEKNIDIRNVQAVCAQRRHNVSGYICYYLEDFNEKDIERRRNLIKEKRIVLINEKKEKIFFLNKKDLKDFLNVTEYKINNCIKNKKIIYKDFIPYY